MAVRCPSRSSPGRASPIELTWTARVPRPFARTGAIGNFFFIAQWFPKLGVLRTRAGTAISSTPRPSSSPTTASTTSPDRAARAGWSAPPVPSARAVDNADGTTTHRYYQEDVHDFAWTTSPEFIERIERFEPTGGTTDRSHGAAAGRDAAADPAGARVAGRAALRGGAARAQVLLGRGSGLSLRPHHGRRSGISERRRRHGVPDAHHRRHVLARPPRDHDQHARRSDDSRSRPPVLLRHRRQQRVRGRVDGRGDQHLRVRPRDAAGRRDERLRAPLFRRVRALGVRTTSPSTARRSGTGCRAIGARPRATRRPTPSFRYLPRTGRTSPTTRRRCG